MSEESLSLDNILPHCRTEAAAPCVSQDSALPAGLLEPTGRLVLRPGGLRLHGAPLAHVRRCRSETARGGSEWDGVGGNRSTWGLDKQRKL